MAKIAICDLLFTWPPDGGARVDVKEIAQRLARHHEVRLFVPDYPACPFPRGIASGSFGFSITRIPFNHLTFSAPFLGKRFAEAVEEFQPDRVWVTDGWFLKPYLILGLKKFSPIVRFYAYESLCIRSHGHCFSCGKLCMRDYLAGDSYLFCLKCAFNWLRRVRPPEFIQEFIGAGSMLPRYRNTVRQSIKASSSLVVYNDFIKDKLLRWNQNIHIVPSGVDCRRFFPKKRPLNGQVTILMAGRVDDYLKGYQVLLDACRILKNNNVNFNLLVTGSNTFGEGFVRTLGWVNTDELPSLYHSADICVVPSIWPEPFGISALEAMASGVPLVATNVGGLGEIFDDGVEGFIVPPNDSVKLAEKLMLLISSARIRRNMGEAGRCRAEFYDWDLIFSQYCISIFRL